jgi:hypothetical protein
MLGLRRETAEPSGLRAQMRKLGPGAFPQEGSTLFAIWHVAFIPNPFRFENKKTAFFN